MGELSVITEILIRERLLDQKRDVTVEEGGAESEI